MAKRRKGIKVGLCSNFGLSTNRQIYTLQYTDKDLNSYLSLSSCNYSENGIDFVSNWRSILTKFLHCFLGPRFLSVKSKHGFVCNDIFVGFLKTNLDYLHLIQQYSSPNHKFALFLQDSTTINRFKKKITEFVQVL